MKMLLLKTWRDLRDSWAQSLALVVIVALGIAAFVALVGAYRDLDTSYEATYERLNFADVTFAVEGAPEEALADLRAIDGVAAVTGRLIIDTGLQLPDSAPVNPDERIQARLIGLPADGHPAVNDVLIQEGRYFSPDAGRVALLEAHLAEVQGWGPGVTLSPLIGGEAVEFEAVGVAASPEYLLLSPSRQVILATARTFAILFVPLSELQSLAGVGARVNNVAVQVAPDADRAAVVDRLEAALQPYGLLTTTLREDQPSNAALQLDLDGYREIAYLMPSLILIAAAFALYVMTGRMVRAQRPQIGVMKALGYKNGAILAHYMSLAVTIGLLGALLGLAAGLPLARSITELYAQELGIPLVETQLYPDLALGGVLLSLVAAVIAGVGPAWGTARIAPAQAMHLHASNTLIQGRKSLVERLTGSPPLWLRLPLRSVFRVRRRSLTTALGLIFAYVLVLMTWGFVDSINHFLDHTFEDVERWDIQASLAAPQPLSLAEQVRGWEGVQAVAPLLQAPATVRIPDGASSEILLIALPPDQRMHVLQLAPGVTPEEALAQGQIVLPEALAKSLGVDVGDQLELDSPLGQATLAVGGITDELMGSAAYVSLATAQEMSEAPAVLINGLYIQAAGDQTDDVEARLYGLGDTVTVQLKADLEQTWRSFMGLFYAFMGVLLAFALAMAFALIFNAMTVNVLERQRELATMRAIGAGRDRVAWTILVENLLLWLITLGPGLVLGYLVARQMGEVFASELFSFAIVISPLSYALTAGGILLTMMLAAWPAIRRVNRLNLAEATKVRV